MSKTTLIEVKETDNELYIIAVPSNGRASAVIGHITSGFNNPVGYKVVPQSILAPGEYTLILIGINWGGPQQFSVDLTGNATPNVNFGAGPAVGASSVSVPMTV